MNTINSTIQYLTITSPEQIAPYTGQLLTLYKSVFGDRIWNEGMKCSNDQCSFQSSFEDTPSDNTCSIPSCRNPLKEFYSNTEISETLQRLFKKKFELIIALQNSIPVGFYWGWEASLDSLNEEKLGLSSAQYGTLKQNLTQYYPL